MPVATSVRSGPRTAIAVTVMSPPRLMTLASASGGLIFNLTTNGNGQMLAERLSALAHDPSTLGLLLGAVYAVASVAQVIVGRLIDRYPLKPLWLAIVLAQAPMLALAATAPGGWAWLALLGSMVFIFGAIPFTDATIVRFVDDRMRSRVAGLRLAISLAISSAAVWALGPAVKAAGFETLFAVMAGVALCTAAILLLLPREPSASLPAASPDVTSAAQGAASAGTA